MWYEPWWQKPGYTPPGYVASNISWLRQTRYKPLAGYYWAGDPANIAAEFGQLKALGVDYLLFDDTNLAVYADGGNVEKNIAAIFREDARLPPEGQLPLSLVIGGELWAARSEVSMRSAADHVFANYAQEALYFRWHGKPLLVSYNAYDGTTPIVGPEWDDPRFTVRYAAGIVDRNNPSIKQAERRYQGIAAHGWWGWVPEYPQLVTAEAIGVTPGADNRHRRVTDPATPCAGCTYTLDRQGGALYEKEWLRAIKANPETIVISSWNDFSDETGIEPAAPASADSPAWSDAYGNTVPDWYVKITAAYANLRIGLMAGGYYRDENGSAAYRVLRGNLVCQTEPPHGHPVVPLPAGLLAGLGAPPCG
jgi:hypothetical protein